jgi:hypothetical protein
MSPASYLTAPPRDAASIVAPPTRANPVVTMAAMALLTWISLLLLLVALAGSITFAALRALRAWRAFRGFTGATSSALADVARTAAEVEEHALGLGQGSERMSAAVSQLQRSLAELAVLQKAASDARGSLFAFRGLVPRK